MTAGHFAAALAIKSRVPKAPTAALILGAFIPDFLWIAFCVGGVEGAQRQTFFDDWSHSFLSIFLCASVFCLFFRRQGRAVTIAVWLAVFSHFFLDVGMQSKGLAFFPHATFHFGLGVNTTSGQTHWLVELVTTLVLLGVYLFSARRLRLPLPPILASCALVLGWHVVLM